MFMLRVLAFFLCFAYLCDNLIMCTLTDIAALAAAGGCIEEGAASRLIMQLSPVDIKCFPMEVSLLMQLAGC
jgi:hypothetical protein